MAVLLRRLSVAPIVLMVCCGPQMLPSEDGYIQFSGRYESPAYAYSAAIPAGLVASKVKPPAPVHGFFIPLPGRPEARIDVNAYYNTLDYPSNHEASAGDAEWFVKQCSSDVKTESEMTILGSLPAIRTTIHCRRRASNLVFESVVALREAPRASDRMSAVIYSVSLMTSGERYLADKKTYEQILGSFQLSK
jgi:hypothetical protein